jgi:uncharacterized MAPEG superfamily protein
MLELIAYTTALTWFAIMAGGFLRNREWTLDGVKVGLSNRDDLPEATPLGGRAERAARNSIEAIVLFVPLALVAHVSGRSDAALFGAQLFFWARVAYLPIYWAGIPYLRSAVWMVGVVGLAMMFKVLL